MGRKTSVNQSIVQPNTEPFKPLQALQNKSGIRFWFFVSYFLLSADTSKLGRVQGLYFCVTELYALRIPMEWRCMCLSGCAARHGGGGGGGECFLNRCHVVYAPPQPPAESRPTSAIRPSILSSDPNSLSTIKKKVDNESNYC